MCFSMFRSQLATFLSDVKHLLGEVAAAMFTPPPRFRGPGAETSPEKPSGWGARPREIAGDPIDVASPITPKTPSPLPSRKLRRIDAPSGSNEGASAAVAAPGMSGRLGLDTYSAWKNEPRNKQNWNTCPLTGSVSSAASNGFDEDSRVFACRRKRPRPYHEVEARRLYGDILPSDDWHWLVFEHRCWWLGINVLQGAVLRRRNLGEGFVWP